MPLPSRKNRGYSLIELLVVLAIVGILAIVSVFMLGDRRGNAVRGVMDELEGVVLAAQRNAMATGTDVTLETSAGTWVAGTWSLDGRQTDPLNPPARLGSSSEIFISHFNQGQRDHMHAGVVGADDYATALGSASALASVPPCDVEPFHSALANNLYTGAVQKITISGLTKRFNTGFCIVVAGLRGGAVGASGPVGVIVVPANMANVFKFYKREGETQWKRL